MADMPATATLTTIGAWAAAGARWCSGSGRVLFRPTVCRRRSDGSFWAPSFPPFWTDCHAILDLRQPKFYFIGMARPCWLPGVWITTGETWTFEDPGLFEILTPRRR